MSTISAPNRRKDPFSRVAKVILDDTRLSWRAKGIVAYLIGKPPGWKLQVSDLVKHGTDGEHAIRAALNELRDHGYAQFTRFRSGGTFSQGHWEISDHPDYSPRCENQDVAPRCDYPDVEEPSVEDQDLSKNDSNKIDSSKNDFAKEAPKAQKPTLKTPPKPSPNSAAPLPDLPMEIAVALADDWQRWQEHLIEKRRPLTPLQAQAQIALLWEMTYQESKDSIRTAIEGGHTRFLLPKKAKDFARTEPAGCTL